VDGFVDGTLPWIRDAVTAQEPILVVVSAAKIARLREELGAAGAEDFWLLCPYDVDALEADVIDKAHHSHPVVVADGSSRDSSTYRDLPAVAAPFAEPLPDPPPGADELPFASGTLAAVRRLVKLRADAAGLLVARAGDLVLAVNEVATNSIRHGGGGGMLRIWQDADALICQITDAGRIADPLAGRRRPASGQSGGHGLWLCNQICDLVQLRTFATGSVVRLHTRRGF
jgi:anti-sigma regulatory factor (Ser/Thr protein kinase)